MAAICALETGQITTTNVWVNRGKVTNKTLGVVHLHIGAPSSI